MALKDEAKKTYQREYMRKLRLKGRLLDPICKTPVRPQLDPRDSKLPNCPDGRYREVDADGNPIPDIT